MSELELFSVGKAAANLQLSRQRVHQLIQDGRLVAWRLGPIWVIDAAELARYRTSLNGHARKFTLDDF